MMKETDLAEPIFDTRGFFTVTFMKHPNENLGSLDESRNDTINGAHDTINDTINGTLFRRLGRIQAIADKEVGL